MCVEDRKSEGEREYVSVCLCVGKSLEGGIEH